MWLLILSTKRLRGVGFRPLLTHLSLSHPTVPFRNPHLPPLLPAVTCQLPGIQTLCLAPDPLKPKETFDLAGYNPRIVRGGNAAGGFSCSGIGIVLSFDCSVSASSSACANCLQARIIFLKYKNKKTTLSSPLPAQNTIQPSPQLLHGLFQTSRSQPMLWISGWEALIQRDWVCVQQQPPLQFSFPVLHFWACCWRLLLQCLISWMVFFYLCTLRICCYMP